ncbi:MAG: metal-sulfur cluster assembly factor [Chloroflexota bacterium]|nr:metal-sulfur cluster assembly factor [Chloroflexota bacterium]
MITEGGLREALKNVYDPELGVNVVDLGLVYGIEQNDGKVTVDMTMTTPGCPLHESLLEGARSALSVFSEVTDVKVKLVWEPPWTPEMMTLDGRRALGWMGS